LTFTNKCQGHIQEANYQRKIGKSFRQHIFLCRFIAVTIALKVTNVRFKTTSQRRFKRLFKRQNSLQRRFKQMFKGQNLLSDALNKCLKSKIHFGEAFNKCSKRVWKYLAGRKNNISFAKISCPCCAQSLLEINM